MGLEGGSQSACGTSPFTGDTGISGSPIAQYLSQFWHHPLGTLALAWAIAVSLSVDHPSMSWSCGHSGNEAFPFRAYASFCGRGPSHTDVVISVDILKKASELWYSSDIALEDGQVLTDGPPAAVRKARHSRPPDQAVPSRLTSRSAT